MMVLIFIFGWALIATAVMAGVLATSSGNPKQPTTQNSTTKL